MAKAFLLFDPFDFGGAQDFYGPPHQGYERKEGSVDKEEKTNLFEMEDFGDLEHLWQEFGLKQDKISQKGVLLPEDQQQQPFSCFGMSDDFHFDMVSQSIQSSQDSKKFDPVLSENSDIVEPKKEKPYQILLASLNLLNNYGSRFKRLNDDELNSQGRHTSTKIHEERLSTEEVMRVAGERYIQFSSQKDDDLSMFRHPYGCALLGLSDEEIKDVEVAHLLLASAEKIGNRQFDRARKLLAHFDYLVSSTGNPVQRIVYYFTQALLERIDRGTGIIPSRGFVEGKQEIDFEEVMMSVNPVLLAYYQDLPFSKVLQFVGIQAIIENVDSVKKVHLIDLSIRTGMQWIVLIQALASRPGCMIELLKITAVGTTSQHKIEKTGERLLNFAKTMNLPFSFKVVMVSNMNDLKEELFELKEDETVAVFSPMVFRTMIAWPDHLETLMKVIKSLNPSIMVVTEIEANHNSMSFVNRFIEALFFYSALFDSFEACMDRNSQTRIMAEGIYIGQVIRNIIAAEGEERTVRHVGIDVWRGFFSQFGLVETELSQSSLYQANLILRQSPYWNSCTIDMKGKCLTVGWKGTPLHSVSAWKFH